MTTITYRDGVMAADTLVTSGNCRLGAHRKIGGRNGLLWGGCGDAAWCKRFRDWVATGLRGKLTKPPNERTGGMIVLPDDKILMVHASGYELRDGLAFWADGSGADYALGAMQMGATADEAVRAAMAWDRATGGDVMVIRR